jgi:hypothetical protein
MQSIINILFTLWNYVSFFFIDPQKKSKVEQLTELLIPITEKIAKKLLKDNNQDSSPQAQVSKPISTREELTKEVKDVTKNLEVADIEIIFKWFSDKLKAENIKRKN